jgi:hypothetical protein
MTRMSEQTWQLVEITEHAINAAGHRALAALDVTLTDDDGSDDPEVVALFHHTCAQLLRPLARQYARANMDNRVDIADVTILGRYLDGFREIIDIWTDRIIDHKIG